MESIGIGSVASDKLALAWWARTLKLQQTAYHIGLIVLSTPTGFSDIQSVNDNNDEAPACVKVISHFSHLKATFGLTALKCITNSKAIMANSHRSSLNFDSATSRLQPD